MASSDKSTFNQFQSVVAILTPVIVAFGGFYGYILKDRVADAQSQLAAMETSIRNVEAMETFFKMMGGENNAEAKMAAYALYMLNKENPEMTVSMIMAPENEDLMAVLIDLGSRDSKILEEVQKILATQDDTKEGTAIQQSAQKIVADIPSTVAAVSADTVSEDGDAGRWSYLGNFVTGEGKRFDLPAGDSPLEGNTYTLTRDVNIRADYPHSENDWQSGSIIGVAREGQRIEVVETQVDSKDHLWARINVVSR